MTQGPLPTTVVGGYLGAGKTTLINALLHQAQPLSVKLAVLVNDFGDVAIDAALIESADNNVMQLAGGCVCCTIGNDLLSTIASLRDTVGEVDHVLVETSGVAMPGTVAATIRIANQVRLNGVLVLADMTHLDRQLRDKYIGDTITRQLDAADLIVCTKTDLMDESQTTQRIAQLAADYPRSRCLAVRNGQLPIDLALHPEPAQPTTTGDGLLAPHHFGSIRPIGERADHGLDYITRTFEAQTPCDPQQLSQLLADPALAVLRSKGFVRNLDGKSQLVQSVAGSVEITRVTEPGPATHQLVIIGLESQLPMPRIREQLAALGIHETGDSAKG